MLAFRGEVVESEHGCRRWTVAAKMLLVVPEVDAGAVPALDRARFTEYLGSGAVLGAAQAEDGDRQMPIMDSVSASARRRMYRGSAARLP